MFSMHFAIANAVVPMTHPALLLLLQMVSRAATSSIAEERSFA